MHGFTSYHLYGILTLLFGALVWIQMTNEREKNAEDRSRARDFEPVLGASWHSFLSVPLFRALRLVCVDALSKHAAFVGCTGFMFFKKIDTLSTTTGGTVLLLGLLALHFLAWVNVCFPDQRTKVVDAMIKILEAAAVRVSGNKPAGTP